MVANIGPAASNFDETMSTLRYADRAKQIKNQPKINEDPKDTKLREMQEVCLLSFTLLFPHLTYFLLGVSQQIATLKAQLQARKGGVAASLSTATSGGRRIRRSAAPGEPEGEDYYEDGDAEVEERIIEKEVVVDGLSEEDVALAKERAKLRAAKALEASLLERNAAEAETLEARRKVEEAERELQLKAELVERERKELVDLERQLLEREQQLLHGGLKLHEAQQKRTELKKLEAEAKQQEEEQMRVAAELAKAEEAELLMNDTYHATQEQLGKLNKKLKQLWHRYQEKRQDLQDIETEWAQEQVELVDTIRELDKMLKLKSLLVESFIPARYSSRIEARAVWDAANDSWLLPGLEIAGNNISRLAQPNSALAGGDEDYLV